VRIDGKPLTEGSVRFIPVGGGRPSITGIGSGRRFDFGKEGVVVARNRIEVIASKQVGQSGYRWYAPEKYSSYATSGLEQEITEPKDDVTINLTWGGGKPFTVDGSSNEPDPKNLKARQ